MVERSTVNRIVPGSSPGEPVDNQTKVCYDCLVVILYLMSLNLNVDSLVRSAVVLAVGLPLALGVSSSLNPVQTSEDPVNDAITDYRLTLVEKCIRYQAAKVDSKLEREAKNDLDESFDGEILHAEVCRWVLR